MKRLLLGALAALCLLPAAAQAQVIFSTPPSCAKAGANTVTASAPVLDCTQTWNNAGITFYGFRLNVADTASASGSLLADLQVAGASKFSVKKNGDVSAAGSATVAGSGAFTQGLYPGGTSGTYFTSIGNGLLVASNSAGTQVVNFGVDGANDIFAHRRGTNPQTVNIYNTYTDASNYERGVLDWSTQANVLTLGTAKAGTGLSRDINIRPLGAIYFQPGALGNAAWDFSSSGHLLAFSDNLYDIGASGATRPRNEFLAGYLITQVTTVSGLTACASGLKGARSFVTDANATTFLSTVAGGGANNVPVVCDGTNWKIG